MAAEAIGEVVWRRTFLEFSRGPVAAETIAEVAAEALATTFLEFSRGSVAAEAIAEVAAEALAAHFS